MTTKKNDTPTDREGKEISFREAQRQDQRASKLWDRSSPTMDDMFATFRRLRISLDTALAAVDGFVSESRRVSDELRKEGCDSKADSLAGWADEWAPVTTPLFRKAATGIVELVYGALVNGYPVHVLKVERPLLDRDLAEWGRLCASQRVLLRTDGKALSLQQYGTQRSFAAELIYGLKEIDGRAQGLTVEQVIESANNRRRPTGAGFAADVACMCGAFKYKLGDQEKAQDAIRKAIRGG